MGTECQLPRSEEDRRMIDEAIKRGVQDWSPETYEKVRPEVREALDQRFDQMMETKNVDFVEKAKEIIEKGESRFSKVPQSSEELEPVEATPEERIMKREAGQELGLSGARWFGSPDIVGFPKEGVKETMAFLNHPEIPRIFTKGETIGQVQYVNQQMIEKETGKRIRGMHQTFVEKDKNTGEIKKVHYTIYVFANEKGECPRGNELKEILSHEIIHGPNKSRIEAYAREHPKELAKALASQAKAGPPSDYSLTDTEEWLCECYRDYLTGQSKLSSGMAEFFSNLREYFSK